MLHACVNLLAKESVAFRLPLRRRCIAVVDRWGRWVSGGAGSEGADVKGRQGAACPRLLVPGAGHDYAQQCIRAGTEPYLCIEYQLCDSCLKVIVHAQMWIVRLYRAEPVGTVVGPQPCWWVHRAATGPAEQL